MESIFVLDGSSYNWIDFTPNFKQFGITGNFIITVLDDEDTTITAGSIVTVSVRLVRKSMEELLGNESALLNDDGTEQKPAVEDEPREPPPEEEVQEEQQEVRKQLLDKNSSRG